MSNWNTITTDNLNAASVSGKVGIIQAAAAARSLPDPAPSAIQFVTQELRGLIGYSGKYTVDQDVTKLPNSLLDLAVKKVVREMTRAINLPFNKDEEADERTYETRCEKIRVGQWPVDPADNPVSVPQVQTSTLSPSIQPRRRRFTHRHEEGI